MWRGISLANKCLLLFGAAVVLIIVAALAVPWLRLTSVVDEGQKETSRRLEEVWEGLKRANPGPQGPFVPGVEEPLGGANNEAGSVVYLPLAEARTLAGREDDSKGPFVANAIELFEANPDRAEYHEAEWRRKGGARAYFYARAVRAETGELQGLIAMERVSPNAAVELLVNTAYLLSAGLIALGLAVLVFYLITSRLILSPVRSLKETAEVVREGNFQVRSEISTGDEFEELSEAFNQMLDAINAGQEKLRAINASLDLKVTELAERNVALFEANRVKGEFLANVSHELRTPLNSIIGFAELLVEIAQKEEAAGDDSSRLAKRKRYLQNICTSGRNLLEMINSLLDMAKVEAGKMDLRVEPMNLRDACEGLAAMIKPLADRAGVELVTELAPDLGTIETDASKFQQIVFNLMSNAVKFTGEHAAAGEGRAARVTLRAERLAARGVEGSAAAERVRVCVLDTGPGIAPADQHRIFEKFEQVEGGHTRRHAGTGLGLAIAKELTHMLQGEIAVESELGRGAMFSVILPAKLDPERAREVRAEMTFRGMLAGQKS